jgi:hypothetical protein
MLIWVWFVWRANVAFCLGNRDEGEVLGQMVLVEYGNKGGGTAVLAMSTESGAGYGSGSRFVL